MAARTPIDVCSYALGLIGIAPIASFDDGSTPSDTANTLYRPTVETLQGIHPWNFNKRTEQLQPSTEGVPDKWALAYPLPSDCLLLRSVRVGDVPITWGLANNAVLANTRVEDKVMAEFTYQVTESEWPPFFLQCVHTKLAALFAAAIARKGDLADFWSKEHDKAMAVAKTADAQQKTQARIRQRLYLYRR
jgi:hypothetical protein